MVEPASLKVSDITIAQYHDPKTGGTLQPFVDFRYSGSTDYVEVQTCAEGSACTPPKSIFETNATLTNAASGARVVVKLRGCVNPARAIGKTNCGSWFEKEYTQWLVADKAKSELQEEFDALERSAADLEKKLQKVLALRAKRAEKCKPKDQSDTQMMEAEKGLVGSLGKLGGGLVGAIANSFAKKPDPAADSSTPDKTDGAGAKDAAVGDFGGGSGDTTALALHANSGLSLEGQGAGQVIAAAASKYVPQLVSKLSDALGEKAKQILTPKSSGSTSAGKTSKPRTATGTAAGTAASAPAAGSTNTPEDTPSTASTDTPSAKDDPAAEAAQQTAAAVQGPSVNWDVISDALPQLAEGIFDLTNVNRRMALENMCIDSLGKVQSDALQIAEEEVTNSVAQLRSAALSVRAKMGKKP